MITKYSAEEIATALTGGRKLQRAGNGFMVCCPNPSHPDQKPSCKIWDTKGGYIGVKCFSRCGEDEPKQALVDQGYIPDWEGIKAKKAEKKLKRNELERLFIKDWLYYDISGALNLKISRFDLFDDLGRFVDKEYIQKTGSFKTPSNDREYKPCPYNVQKLKAAAEKGAVLFDVEGEECADQLISRGFTATTTPGGSNATEGYLLAEPFKYAEGAAFVVVLDDLDIPGLEYALFKCWQYYKRGIPVKLIHLPGMGPRLDSKGRDIKDWFVIYNRTPEELRELVSEAPLWEPVGDEEEKERKKEEEKKVIQLFTEGQDRALTETFNAEIFKKHHGSDLLYVRDDDKVRLWDGTRYKLDKGDNDSFILVQDCNDKLLPAELNNKKLDADQKRRWLRSCLNKSTINNTLSIIKKRSCIDLPKLDQDPDILCCLNGVVNLKTGELTPHGEHTKSLLLTKLAPFNYNPKAKCPEFMEFQKRIWAGDEDMIAFNKRWRGLGLTGQVGEQKVRLNKGKGANGKSVDMNLARRIGGDTAISVKSQMFMKKREGQENQLDSYIQLVGIRAAFVGEIPQGAQLDDGKIKEVSGGDECQYRVFFQTEPVSFFPQAKIEFRTNYKPGATTDDALWRRLMVVNYGVTFKGKEKIQDFDQYLFNKEADGIGTYFVMGAIDYYEYGLLEPDSVIADSQKYRAEEDLPWQFVSQWCAKADRASTASQLHHYFKAWCKAEGYDKVISPKTLRKELERLGYAPDPDDATKIQGIVIKPEILYSKNGDDDH